MTPVSKPEKASNRVVQRRRYFFDRLLSVTGGDLKGMRVLDLGCNAGYWSLQAIEAGADFVFGIDGRQMHVDQANLVFEAKGVEPSRYRFEVGNFLHRSFGAFDLALCLGVLYHVSSPVDLFDAMAATKAELLLIDTEVSPLRGNVVELWTEAADDYRNAISSPGDEDCVVGYPTRGRDHHAGQSARLRGRGARCQLHQRLHSRPRLRTGGASRFHLLARAVPRYAPEGGAPRVFGSTGWSTDSP